MEEGLIFFELDGWMHCTAWTSLPLVSFRVRAAADALALHPNAFSPLAAQEQYQGARGA